MSGTVTTVFPSGLLTSSDAANAIIGKEMADNINPKFNPLFISSWLLFLLEYQWQKLVKTSAPGEPFVMSARRFLIRMLDAGMLKRGRNFIAAEVLLRAHAEKESVHLVIERLAVGKHSIIYAVNLSRIKKQRAAE